MNGGRELLPFVRGLEHPAHKAGNRAGPRLKKKHLETVAIKGFDAFKTIAAHTLGCTRAFAEL